MTLCRRALAFTGNNVDNARAVLIADQEDEKEEADRLARAEERAIREHEASMKSIRVDANFDPTQISTTGSDGAKFKSGQDTPSKHIRKEDVIFYANSSTLESLVLDSPVPVLLDVYADWCGPCKKLTPILEEITLKAGGLFRLVKLNVDEERTISQALEVTALPTLFTIRDGHIQTSFQGFPPNEDFVKHFMMGLVGAGPAYPIPSTEEKHKLDNLTTKLMKLVGAASFSFSQREILQRRIDERLDEMIMTAKNGDFMDIEEAMRILRSLLSNIIQYPYDVKYRKINLENRIIASKLAIYPPAIAILRSIGFNKDTQDSKHLLLGNGTKKYINLTALTIARDSIDKWIDRHRRDIAAAERKRADDALRSKLAAEDTHVFESKTKEMNSVIETVAEANVTNIQIRLEGKKKIYSFKVSIEDPLTSILNYSPLIDMDTTNVTITCTGKKLTVKSGDAPTMQKSFRELKLYPNVVLVIKVGDLSKSNTSQLKERAEQRRTLKKGEHTMQSIGIYAKDDGAKGELIDGGGGVWYEHDVSDDDEGDRKKS